MRASLRSFEEPFDLYGHLTKVGARIGAAMLPADGENTDVLLEHASLARVRAERDGPGAVCFYHDAVDAELRERRALESDLAHALERDQFAVHYQPQFDIASRRMVGVEALLRRIHPARGSISPDHFIPLAEDSGPDPADQRLGARAGVRPGGALTGGSADAAHVGQDVAGAVPPADRAGVVGDILRRSGRAAPYLELEITKRVLMRDTQANLETLRRIRSLGVRTSIHDFGVGCSSLSYLCRFPFDDIKVDRSCVGASEHDPSAAAIVRATLSVARNLGLASLAAGVESASQLSLLRAEGCCIAQGSYFSPPVRPREVAAMIDAAAVTRNINSGDHEVQTTD